MKKITYIFQKDRLNKLKKNEFFAQDFFYGSTLFDQEKYDIKIIELNNYLISNKKLTKFLDKILIKISNLPFNIHRYSFFKNFSTIKNSDFLFVVNQSVGFALLPTLIILNKISRTNVSIFVMGLFSKKTDSKIVNILQKKFINLLYKNVDNILFLGKAEYIHAQEFFKSSKKLIYFPFAIDTNFWKKQNSLEKKKYDLIFVGNDSNKNYKFVIDLIENLPKLNFLIISNKSIFKNKHFNNAEVIYGSWNSDDISDVKLRNYYLNSKISILPLNNTLQPSGQSVALQSMALELPVIISNTIGFWDNDNFMNNKNIFLLNNELKQWIDKINEVLYDHEIGFQVTQNALDVIYKNYTLDIFLNNLNKLIEEC